LSLIATVSLLLLISFHVQESRAITSSTVVSQNKPAKAMYFGYSLVMWSSDFHISPVWDTKWIISKFEAVKMIDKSLSGHCHLTNTCEKNLKVINKQNGIKLNPCPNTIRRQFYDFYQNDPEMKSVDAFLCTHASSLCELFMPFNKSIIFIASTR
jgi:hypothetical protein